MEVGWVRWRHLLFPFEGGTHVLNNLKDESFLIAVCRHLARAFDANSARGQPSIVVQAASSVLARQSWIASARSRKIGVSGIRCAAYYLFVVHISAGARR